MFSKEKTQLMTLLAYCFAQLSQQENGLTTLNCLQDLAKNLTINSRQSTPETLEIQKACIKNLMMIFHAETLEATFPKFNLTEQEKSNLNRILNDLTLDKNKEENIEKYGTAVNIMTRLGRLLDDFLPIYQQSLSEYLQTRVGESVASANFPLEIDGELKEDDEVMMSARELEIPAAQVELLDEPKLAKDFLNICLFGSIHELRKFVASYPGVVHLIHEGRTIFENLAKVKLVLSKKKDPKRSQAAQCVEKLQYLVEQGAKFLKPSEQWYKDGYEGINLAIQLRNEYEIAAHLLMMGVKDAKEAQEMFSTYQQYDLENPSDAALLSKIYAVINNHKPDQQERLKHLHLSENPVLICAQPREVVATSNKNNLLKDSDVFAAWKIDAQGYKQWTFFAGHLSSNIVRPKKILYLNEQPDMGESILMAAACAGRYDALIKLLMQGPFPNKTIQADKGDVFMASFISFLSPFEPEQVNILRLLQTHHGIDLKAEVQLGRPKRNYGDSSRRVVSHSQLLENALEVGRADIIEIYHETSPYLHKSAEASPAPVAFSAAASGLSGPCAPSSPSAASSASPAAVSASSVAQLFSTIGY